jgi:hypothetical protein
VLYNRTRYLRGHLTTQTDININVLYQPHQIIQPMPKSEKKTKAEAKPKSKGKNVKDHEKVRRAHALIAAFRSKGLNFGDQKGFIRVSTDAKGATVTETVPSPVSEQVAMTRDLLRSSLGAAPIKVRLCQKVTSASVSGLDLTTVSNLVPGSSNDWSNFSALFDAARCLGVRVHWGVASASTPTVGAAVGALTFDPGNPGVQPSVANCLESAYKIGPVRVANLYGSSSPNAMDRTGFWTLDAKCKPNIESGFSADLVGSNWFPTGTSSAIVGYLKPFIESPGAMVVTSIMYIEYEVEFAYRT